MKTFFISLAAIILLIVVAFSLKLGGLQWTRFFAPKEQAIQREVFEETKSFVHGKTQDLAKYYEEYTKSTDEGEKQSIENLIKIQFSDIDSSQIRNNRLRQFLISVRGY